MLYMLVPRKHQKWAALLGCFFIHLSLGTYSTTTNMLPYYTSYFRESDGSDIRYASTVWMVNVCSICMTSASIAGAILNLKKKISLRLIIFIGCVTMSIGLLLTFFTVKISFEMTVLTYSIIMGIGVGLAYLGPIFIAMKWFPTSRGLASAAVLFGYGTGPVIFNLIQTRFINPNNYSPDKPYSPDFPDEKYFSKLHMDLLNQVPKSFVLIAGVSFALQLIGLSLLTEYTKPQEGSDEERANFVVNKNYENYKEEVNPRITKGSDEERANLTENQDNVIETELKEENSVEDINSLGVNYKSVDGGMTSKEAFRTRAFWVIVLISNFSGIASSNVSTFFKTFGQTFIHDDMFFSTVSSVASLASALGSLAWGFMIDRLPVKVYMLIVQTIMLALVSTFYFSKFLPYKPVYLIWVVLIHTMMSGIPATLPSIAAKFFGQKYFKPIYGYIWLTNLASSFISSTIDSHKDAFGWFWFFFFSCCLSMIGWLASFFLNVKKSNGDDI